MAEEHRNRLSQFWELSKLFSKPHPWHGIYIGPDAPERVKVFVEIVPGDTMKYELDKDSGYLKVDRPQRYSNFVPEPYGFIPQTLCSDRVGEYCAQQTGRDNIVGDEDPLDICVVTERSIPHGDLIMEAVPVGGLRMIDGDEADDKIVAVLKNDALFGEARDISDVPEMLIDRITHYFLTYKDMPDGHKNQCEITDIYGREEALEVIRRSQLDYEEEFLDVKGDIAEILMDNFGKKKKEIE